MTENIVVIHTPNSGPPVDEVWAFVSRDAAGRENVVGGVLPGLGLTALTTGNRNTFEMMKRVVLEGLPQLEDAGKTIHLLHFSQREEVEGWRG